MKTNFALRVSVWLFIVFTLKTASAQTIPDDCNNPLTGKDVVIDQLTSGLAGLLTITNDYENVIDGNLTNFVEISGLDNTGVLGTSLVAVKNVRSTYPSGRRVGFVIEATGGLLSASILNSLTINTYLDDALQESADLVGGGPLIDLRLLGGTGSKRRVSFVTSQPFDEVELQLSGIISSSLLSGLRIYYAYEEVDGCDYNCVTAITPQNGYTSSINGARTGFVSGVCILCGGVSNAGNVVDNDTTIFGQIDYGLVSVGATYAISVNTGTTIGADNDVGFAIESSGLLGLLDLSVLGNIRLTTYLANTQQETILADAALANVGVLSGNINLVSFRNSLPFDEIRISITNTSAGQDFFVYYAFVREDTDGDGLPDCVDKCALGDDNFDDDGDGIPDACDTPCTVSPLLNLSVCVDQTTAQLPAAGPGQTWSALPGNPSPAMIDNSGLVTGLSAEGTYMFQLSDGNCSATVSVEYSLSTAGADCNQPIAGPTASIGNNAGCLLCGDPDAGNIVDGNLSNFLQDNTFLSLAVGGSGSPLVSVIDNARTYPSGTRTGFVVSFPTGLLTANLLDAFRIRTYNDGALVETSGLSGANVLRADVLGGNQQQRITFEASQPFDEVELVAVDGIVSLDLLSSIRIYYAFTEPNTCPGDTGSGFDPNAICETPAISSTDVCGMINYDRTGITGVANVDMEIDALAHLLDDDLTNFTTIELLVTAVGEASISVKLPYTVPMGSEAGYLIRIDPDLLGVGALANLELTTYLNGIQQDMFNGSSPLVTLSLLGSGSDLSYFSFTAQNDFDEIQLTVDANLASINALGGDIDVFYAFYRLDSDGDGVPDCRDKCCISDDNLLDSDGDCVPDVNDLDDDNDGVADTAESGGADPLADADNDGTANFADPDYPGFVDSNGDGINDNFDVDQDGIPNYLDLDSDNDGLADVVESGGADSDGNGLLDNFTDNDYDGLHDNVDADDNNPDPVASGDGLGVPDADGDGSPNSQDLDSDNDGVPDAVEVGGVDQDGDGKLENFVDTDGDGFADTVDGDTDNDGVIDNPGGPLITTGMDNDNDGSPDTTPNYIAANSDGDEIYNFLDLDSDNDGISDVTEAGGTDANNDGQLDGFTDTDNDGFSDSVDGDVGNDGTAENTANALIPTGADGNNDGRPDAYPNANADGEGLPNPYDLDSDGDAVPDIVEAGGVDIDGDGYIDGSQTADNDADGLLDAYDANDGGNAIANLDTDGDGVNNFLDLDSDNDGIPDVIEAGGTDADNDGQLDGFTDTDNDGLGDSVDGDVGNDGTAENTANALIPTGTDGNNDGTPDTYLNANADGTGLPNPYDLDADDDGMLDTREGNVPDSDNDGIADGADGDGNGWTGTIDGNEGGTSVNAPDTDSDGISDHQDIDSDNDGIIDNVEGQSTAGFVAPTGTDADNDGIDAAYDNNDAAFGGNTDNGITPENTDGADDPDYLDLDTDNDTRPDRTEGWDTNGNGLIDGAEIAYVGTTDSDGDGLLDEYDMNDNTATSGINNTTNNGSTPASYPDVVNPGGDRDWREATDTDNDTIADVDDIDDDNDGVLDTDESDGADPLADADNDNIPNYQDPDFCTLNSFGVCASLDEDEDGIISSLDLDSDNDGIPDVTENRGSDPDGNGIVGTGAVPMDTDGDGLADVVDADNGGTPITNIDTDGDGVPDSQDLDSDNDGLTDVVESGFPDPDNNGIIGTGDMPTDTDGDGLADAADQSPMDFGDGGNTDIPQDIDQDGLPNSQDIDSDNDGLTDVVENGLPDPDGNGIVGTGATPTDTDGDGLADVTDQRPMDFGDGGNTDVAPDNDGDGNPDYLDIDADDDGIPDLIEQQTTAGYMPPFGIDMDGDGLDDAYDQSGSFGDAGDTNIPTNTDNFDVPDYLDLDADNDMESDVLEGFDTNGNGVIDGMERSPTTMDSDNDGLDDGFDNVILSAGTSVTNSGNAATPLSYPDVDNPGGDRDWRDQFSTPDLTVGVQTQPSSIDEGGMATITYNLSNVGAGPTNGSTILLRIFKVSNFGTLNLSALPPGWTINASTTTYYDLTSSNIVNIGLVNRVVFQATFTHDGDDEDAVVDFTASILPGSGGEEDSNNNTDAGKVQVN